MEQRQAPSRKRRPSLITRIALAVVAAFLLVPGLLLLARWEWVMGWLPGVGATPEQAAAAISGALNAYYADHGEYPPYLVGDGRTPLGCYCSSPTPATRTG